jgi:hypothetical protein
MRATAIRRNTLVVTTTPVRWTTNGTMVINPDGTCIVHKSNFNGTDVITIFKFVTLNIVAVLMKLTITVTPVMMHQLQTMMQ